METKFQASRINYILLLTVNCLTTLFYLCYFCCSVLNATSYMVGELEILPWPDCHGGKQVRFVFLNGV
jgi:hypothetical protein